MTIIRLRGRARKGISWASENWSRVVIAHRTDVPDLHDYYPGTFNIQLHESWYPPADERFRKKSHERGIELGERADLGADFLANGNYIHPLIHVRTINGVPVDGLLYFPGVRKDRWRDDPLFWERPRAKSRIEVISKMMIRQVLGLDPGSEHEVEAEMASDEPTATG